MRVTPTALLGSWVRQPIEDMMSLETDFETHAKWLMYALVGERIGCWYSKR
jgi:hypothetical protein